MALTEFSEDTQNRLSDIVNDVAEFIVNNHLEWFEVRTMAEVLAHIADTGRVLD